MKSLLCLVALAAAVTHASAEWALILDGKVTEKFEAKPSFHPGLMSHVEEVSPGVGVGSIRGGSNWVSVAEQQTEKDAQQQAVIAAKAQAVTKLAKKYRTVLQAHYGAGAETNREVTVTRVSADMIDSDDAEWPARDILILTKGFETLRDITGADNTWTFPWHLVEE
jgi:hypothetical protein